MLKMRAYVYLSSSLMDACQSWLTAREEEKRSASLLDSVLPISILFSQNVYLKLTQLQKS